LNEYIDLASSYVKKTESDLDELEGWFSRMENSYADIANFLGKKNFENFEFKKMTSDFTLTFKDFE